LQTTVQRALKTKGLYAADCLRSLYWAVRCTSKPTKGSMSVVNSGINKKYINKKWQIFIYSLLYACARSPNNHTHCW